jgi:hypothetical protein
MALTLPTVRGVLWTEQHSQWRWILAAASAEAAAAHVPVVSAHLHQAPYMGILFVALVAVCTVLAVAAVVRDSAAVYAGAALTCGLAIVGYVATRVVAFPQLSDDVGNWLEPLGIVSISAETTVVLAAAAALREATLRLELGARPVSQSAGLTTVNLGR